MKVSSQFTFIRHILLVFVLLFLTSLETVIAFEAPPKDCKAFVSHPGPQPYMETVYPQPGYMKFQGYLWKIRGDVACTDGSNQQTPEGGQTECKTKLGVPLEQAWCYGFGANNEKPFCLQYAGDSNACTEMSLTPTATPIPTATPLPEKRACSSGPPADSSEQWSTDCSNSCTTSSSQGQGNAYDTNWKTSLTAGSCDIKKYTNAKEVLCYPFKDGNHCTYRTSGSSSSGSGSGKTDSGSGSGSSSEQAKVANAAAITEKLVQNIKNVCGPNVNSGTASCIPKIQPPTRPDLKFAMVREFMDSISYKAWPVLQCVRFAKVAFMFYTGCEPQRDNRPCTNDNTAGDATDYAHGSFVNASILPKSVVPKEGDLIVFYSMHIAVVEKVLDSTVLICEGNLDSNGQVNCGRPISRGSGDIAAYVRAK